MVFAKPRCQLWGMQQTNENFAMDLRERRLSKGWSQEHLAQLSGLSVRTIQRIEGGRTPGLESLKCLAAVFEVDVTELNQEPAMDHAQEDTANVEIE